MMPALQLVMVVHVLPSAPYDVPGHTLHDPLESLLPTAHLVQEGTGWPMMPALQLVMVVHVLPSAPYDVPGHGVHNPLESLLPCWHFPHSPWPSHCKHHD